MNKQEIEIELKRLEIALTSGEIANSMEYASVNRSIIELKKGLESMKLLVSETRDLDPPPTVPT